MKKGLLMLSILFLAAAGLFFAEKKGFFDLGEFVSKWIPSSGQEETEIRGQIEYVEGAVEKRMDQKDGWREIAQGEVVKSGMEIRTLGNSRVVITFEDGSVARMGAEGFLKLESKEGNLKIELSNGELYNRVTTSAKREYSVVVDEYEIVARGTAFGVEKTKNQDPEVTVIESEVEIKAMDDQLIGFVSEGEKTIVKNKEVKSEQLTQEDLEKEFLAWNIENDKKHFNKTISFESVKKKAPVEEKKQAVVEVQKQEEKKIVEKEAIKKEVKKEDDGFATAISLSGKEDGTKVRFSWSISGGKAPKGFKIVKSKQPNPVFPGDDYLYIKDPDDRSAVWKGFKKDKTYYFRICVYKGGKCGAYSKNVEIEFEGK